MFSVLVFILVFVLVLVFVLLLVLVLVFALLLVFVLSFVFVLLFISTFVLSVILVFVSILVFVFVLKSIFVLVFASKLISIFSFCIYINRFIFNSVFHFFLFCCFVLYLLLLFLHPNLLHSLMLQKRLLTGKSLFLSFIIFAGTSIVNAMPFFVPISSSILISQHHFLFLHKLLLFVHSKLLPAPIVSKAALAGTNVLSSNITGGISVSLYFFSINYNIYFFSFIVMCFTIII